MPKMNAVRKLKKAPGLEYAETEIPEIKDDEILVKVKACSLCGTDLSIYKWIYPWTERILPPRTIGHEVCGIVEKVGKNCNSD